MATATIYASANSNAIRCYSAVYATARAGLGTLELVSDVDARIGQYLSAPNYYVYQQLLEFNLLSLAGATITAATFSDFVWAIDGTPGYVIEMRVHDFGSAITTGDFVAGASLAAKTLVADWTSAAPDTEYKAFDDVALVANLTAGTTNRFILVGANQTTNTAPTGAEYISAYYSTAVGELPKLDITYTPAASAASDSELGNLSDLTL